MADRDRATLTELTAFRRKLLEWAKNELQKENPGYIEAFSQRLAETGDLDRAIKETKPLLGAPPDWYPLLTAMADTEMVLDKVQRAVWFLAVAPPSRAGELWHPGAWAVYHVDHWTFEIYALMEGMNKLIKRTVRHLIRPDNPQWRDVENRLVASVTKIRDSIAKVRDPLAHGYGGGVTGIEEERLWEPHLAVAPKGEVDLVQARYQSIQDGGYQQKWYERLRQGTALVIAAMESIFKDLSKEAFGSS